MSVAILHPSGLTGEALREELERNGDLGQGLGLYSVDETEVGTLTDLAGAAAFVQRYAPGELERFSHVFLCGSPATFEAVLAELPASATPILVPTDPGTAGARPIVAGVNDGDIAAGERLLSAHPAVVLLARLLAPLRPLGLRQATATVTLPASISGRKEALDELFEQTRALLAFSSQRPQAVFGRQLAFNLFALPEVTGSLGEQLRAVLPGLDASVGVVQGGVFHGISASVGLRFRPDPGAEAIREALMEAGGIELADDEDEPSPVDAASREEILVGELAHDGETRWLWAVMDNLTTGGARNAVAILKTLTGTD